ncbi:MAG: methyltransferase domain-containing protein [Alphaproteobacteria bacterium]|jgi:ubiquinone/menaquinone biosynthesis C-methylase UbiE
MKNEHGFQDHWVDIEPERLERYETMYQWNPTTAHYYDAARIEEGLTVGDFGCGPGHAAIEFAKRVGANGHVHAFDINTEFVRRARARAKSQDLDDRITVHLLEDPRLPLDDGCLDRVIARNTIIYVPDPIDTFGEFRRVLRPGGIAHAIESDWRLTAVEPLQTENWRTLVEAASWAWPHPEIGRGLYGIARQAGFDEISLQVLTQPDMDGRLHGMIRTVAGFAKESGELGVEHIDSILATIERATADGTYLAISPQFIVTAIA